MGAEWLQKKESRSGQGKTGWTSSTDISRTWTLPGKKQKNWQQKTESYLFQQESEKVNAS